MKLRLWPVLLASGLGLAILLGLGTWQLQRLQWKEALIAAMDAQLAHAPVTMAEAGSGGLANRRLRLTGRFEGQPLRKMAALQGGPGFEIIQPFAVVEGGTFLVVRGITAEGQEALPRPGDLEIIGIIKPHTGGQGLFDPDNNPSENRWYWWDVPAMYKAAGSSGPSHEIAVLHLLPGSPGTEGLFVEEPKAGLRNNHLGYAITWFGLAAVLVVITGLFLHQQHGKAGA